MPQGLFGYLVRRPLGTVLLGADGRIRFAPYMSDADCIRLAEWDQVFVDQENAYTDEEWYQINQYKWEQAADLANERYWEEGPAHLAVYRQMQQDEEDQRAAYGLGGF